VALHLVAFLGNRSLALDEARLSLNIASRSYSQLFPPLDQNQSAPILFLWAERLTVSLLGINELALRLVPFLAGLTFLLLTPLVARRLLGPTGAVLATAMAAVSTALVAYSTAVKQYSVEALVTLVLLLLTLRWAEAPDSQGRRGALVIGGITAVWLSGPAIFVLAGVCLAVWSRNRRRGPGSDGLPYWLAAGCLASFALAYVIVYRSASQDGYIQRFWASTMLGTAGSADIAFPVRAIMGVIWGYAAYPFELPASISGWYLPAACVVLVTLAVLGLRQIGRNSGWVGLALCGGPVVMVAVASVLGFYPLNVRLMLFAIPLYHLCLSGGILRLAASLGTGLEAVGQLALGLLLLLPQLRLAAFTATTDLGSAPMRQAVGYLRGHRRSEPVYVFARSIPEWAFYTTSWSAPNEARLRWLLRMSRSGGAAFENAPSRPGAVGATEGSQLQRVSPDGLELLGLPSGMEWVALDRVQATAPDPGWVGREASRVQAVAAPGVWVLMSTYYPSERQLFDTLVARRGRITYSQTGPKLVLIRYEFPAAR
jgi:hypothetical protein